jgi:hypothetical protein
MTNQTQDLYQLLYELRKKEQGQEYGYLLTHKTAEGRDWWMDVMKGQHPPIPAASIEDLRKAGMMPEPEPVIKGFERVDTAPPPFLCKIRHYGTSCEKQCAECDVDAQAARKHNDALTNGTFVPPSITLEDYARMEREEEAITSPAHYKVCEGLEVVDMIRAVLTPEQFKGYCLGNLIKYRMRAGKKTMSPMEDLGKAHVYETWLAEMEGGED